MAKDGLRSWAVIVLVCLALTIAQADRALLSIAAPAILAGEHVSGSRLGLLLSAFAWTYTLCQLPSGWLVDRYGPRRLLAAAIVLWSLSCAATGISAHFAIIAGCRLLLGIFESPLHATAHSVMSSMISDRRRGLAAAVYSKGSSLGPMLGALVGSHLLLAMGWQKMFVVVGLCSMLFVIPWLMVVPDQPRPATTPRKSLDWSVLRDLLGRRAVWGISLGYFGFLYPFFVYATWLPTYLAQTRGVSITQIAWMSTVPAIIALLVGPASGWFSDLMIGRGCSQTLVRKTAIGIGLTLGLAVVPAAFSESASQAAVLFMIALAGESISATNMLALPSAIAPEGHAGVVGSFQQMMGGLGGIVSPLVTGLLLDATHDYKAAVLCAAAMLCFAGFSFIVLTPGIERLSLRDRTSTHDRAETAT